MNKPKKQIIPQALLFLCLLFILVLPSPSEAQEIARLQNVIVANHQATPAELKDLLLIRNTQTIPAEIGMKLLPGDMIATGNSVAIITFSKGDIETMLFENSQLDILNPSVRAVLGNLLVKIREGFSKSAFKVKTRFGTAGAEGTIFQVQASSNKVLIGVFEGKVRVEAEGVPPPPAIVAESMEAVVLRREQPPEKIPMQLIETKSFVTRVRDIERLIAATSHATPVPDPSDLKAEFRKQVQEAQTLLVALGYDPGATDGELSTQTTTAVRLFNRDQSLQGEPVIDQALLKALRAEWQRRNAQFIAEQPEQTEKVGIPPPPGGKQYGGKILTVQELRTCAIRGVELQKGDAALARDSKVLEAEQEKLNQESRALDAELASLDKSDPQAVDRHNAEVDRLKDKQKRFNEGALAAYNKKASKLDALNREIKVLCDNRIAYSDDIEAVMKDLGLKSFPLKLTQQQLPSQGMTNVLDRISK